LERLLVEKSSESACRFYASSWAGSIPKSAGGILIAAIWLHPKFLHSTLFVEALRHDALCELETRALEPSAHSFRHMEGEAGQPADGQPSQQQQPAQQQPAQQQQQQQQPAQQQQQQKAKKTLAEMEEEAGEWWRPDGSESDDDEQAQQEQPQDELFDPDAGALRRRP
jgi:hypothetical protein